MNVLVAGGAGYIGSHMCLKLQKAGFRPIILDNFSTGRWKPLDVIPVVEGSIGDRQIVEYALKEFNIDVVMHFAAFIEVSESVINPAKYYKNNFNNVVNLVDQMIECNVKNFIFSSTAAVYANSSEGIPLKETDPCQPINPYGKSKYMVENLLEDYKKAYGLNYTVFRYFNAAGADDSGLLGEDHNPESHLIPRILKTITGEIEFIKIFGTDYNTPDGTCIRDYIHVNDIADAHILGLGRMITEGVSDTFNLGNGKGFSVKEVINTIEDVTGCVIPVREASSRDGDNSILIADATKANKVLGWKPAYNLIQIIKTAWTWEKNKNKHKNS